MIGRWETQMLTIQISLISDSVNQLHHINQDYLYINPFDVNHVSSYCYNKKKKQDFKESPTAY